MKKLHLRNVILCNECGHWRKEYSPVQGVGDQSARMCEQWSWDELCFTKPDGYCYKAVPRDKES